MTKEITDKIKDSYSVLSTHKRDYKVKLTFFKKIAYSIYLMIKPPYL